MMLLEHQDIFAGICGPSRWKELSKKSGSKILPCGDGSCWNTFKPIASLTAKENGNKRRRVLSLLSPSRSNGVRSKRYHVVPYGELNGISIAIVARYEETNLVLNWEKCHFMVRDGIVLGHKISKAGIEVDKAKGSENLAADHLSILENPELEELDEDAIRDSFPDKHLMVINIKEAETDPWMTNKAPIGSTPFRIIYRKACHLPLKMEHKAYWALKEVNVDLDAAGKH
nr:DNA-directed DNA polymerase [Tanacetum cinerariifolium]